MSIKASEISDLIKARIQNFAAATEARSVGSVVTVTDGICRIHGLQDVMQGEMLEFPKNTFGLALNLERDSVGAVIEAAVGAGATGVRGLRFEVSDPAEARASALEHAVQGARVKADAMASAAGASVAGVERIVEEGAARPVYEQFRAAALSASDAAVAVVPPDELDTSVTVTVTWRLG